jgi:hypothetical protein
MRQIVQRVAVPFLLVVILGVALGAANSDLVARVFLPFATKGGALPEVGTLTGRVRIGPLCPVEPCPQPTPDVYSSRRLLLTRKDGLRNEAPLHSDGSFQAVLAAGVYAVDLSDCVYLGCRQALPKQVTIESGKVTTLEIDIDTGIR